jgi:phospholipid N-methyltransferase
MDSSVYVRPNKPKHVTAPEKVELEHIEFSEAPKPVVVHASTECHVTPPAIAERMVELLELESDDHVLEPSGGTGNLVQAVKAVGHDADFITIVEREYSLVQALLQRFCSADCDGVVPLVHNEDFLSWAEARYNAGYRYEKIIMNPPFKQVKAHMEAARKLLRFTGVLIAVVPTTFDHPSYEEIETLPSDTFSTCKVFTKIVRYEG